MDKQIENLKLCDVMESNNNLEIIKWLQLKQLIPTSLQCQKCNKDYKFVDRSDIPDQYAWRCSTCRNTY